jgi:hypothetical protein
MRKLAIAVAVAGSAALIASVANAGCSDPRLPAVRDSILASCQSASSDGSGSCTGNHGQYVSCVARAANTAVRNDELDTNCKGKVTRCAARSTCGKKEGFVTCTICNPGTCTIPSGSTAGTCDDGTTSCTDSSTCPPVVDRCSIKSDASRCVVNGGAPAGSTAVVDSSTGATCCHASCTLD